VKVPFFRLRLTAAEKKAVLEAVKSGWVTSGPRVRQFEKKIARLTGARYAAAVSSGTAGLHLVLETLGLNGTDEVITTPFTMVATIEAIIYAGARPVLADIDPVTLNIDPAAVETKLSRRSRCLLTVDMAGCPCDYARLRRLARKHGLFLLDDAAHALGAHFDGKPIGSIADATVFSFYSTKNITTGEGGMVVADSKRLIDRIRRLSLHGMTSSGWKRYAGGGWKYDVTELGYKYNMSDLAAALGLGQLARFDLLQEKRKRLADRYLLELKDLWPYLEMPVCDEDTDPGWHLFIIKINPRRWRIGRDRLIAELEKRGVGCGVHFIPVYRFSYFIRRFGFRPDDFPHCQEAFRRVISLPFYPDLTNEEVAYVGRVLNRLTERFGR